MKFIITSIALSVAASLPGAPLEIPTTVGTVQSGDEGAYLLQATQIMATADAQPEMLQTEMSNEHLEWFQMNGLPVVQITADMSHAEVLDTLIGYCADLAPAQCAKSKERGLCEVRGQSCTPFAPESLLDPESADDSEDFEGFPSFPDAENLSPAEMLDAATTYCGQLHTDQCAISTHHGLCEVSGTACIPVGPENFQDENLLQETGSFNFIPEDCWNDCGRGSCGNSCQCSACGSGVCHRECHHTWPWQGKFHCCEGGKSIWRSIGGILQHGVWIVENGHKVWSKKWHEMWQSNKKSKKSKRR